MAYLIPKNTVVIVRKPNGELVSHRLREDARLRADQLVAARQMLQFQRDDGFTILVNAVKVAEALHACPQCARVHGVEGLCDECRLSWLPVAQKEARTEEGRGRKAR